MTLQARKSVTWAILLVAIVVAVFLIATSGGSNYSIFVPVDNAAGLKTGGTVQVGAVTRGKVKLHLRKGDKVEIELQMDKNAPKIGKDAKARIVAANFLGKKQIILDPGNASDRAPNGYRLPAAQVSTPTDLDQVLDVFDTDTRTRAQILLNELGQAVVGRQGDIRHLFAVFPGGLVDANQSLKLIKTDNTTMRSLLGRSNRFITEVDNDRQDLARMITTVGETAKTVNAKTSQLQATLHDAPATLRTLRGFLGDLQDTTVTLGPAARDISATAPSLNATLAQVDGFRKAADPTLDTATSVAPSLSKLAKGATPVLKQARPTVKSLATLLKTSPPVGTTLDNSADNIITILENWSRAIQFRDRMGHVFRGEASISPDFVLSMVNRFIATENKKKPAKKKASKKPSAQTIPVKAPESKPDTKKPVKSIVDKLPKLPIVDQIVKNLPENPTVKQLDDALKGVLAPQATPAPKDGKTDSLLDFLLGK